MVTYKISLATINDVKDFVNMVMKLSLIHI